MPERLTRSSLTDELRSQFNLEKGLLKTAVDLTVRPATMLLSYLDGTERSKYVGVVAYFLLSISVTLGLDAALGVDDEFVEYQKSESGGLEGTNITDEEYWAFEETINRHTHYVIYLYVPIAALVTWGFFRFWGLSYLENFVINAFVIAHLEIIGVPLFLTVLLLPIELAVDVNGVLSFIILITYLCYVYFLLSQNYRQAYPIRNITRSVAVSTFQLITLVAVSVLAIVAVYVGYGVWRNLTG